MNYHMSKVSSNSKTGPIPVTTSHKETCPDACPLKAKGCYAAGGPSNIHWKAVSEGKRGGSFAELCEQIKGLPRGQLWRHNQAGDLPNVPESGEWIDAASVSKLVAANKGRKGFTYTHYKPVEQNATIIKLANEGGFTINLSGNNVEHADKLKALGIAPVVTILPMDAPNVQISPAGNKVVACPAEKSDKVNCANCGLCQIADRQYIIGFRAHGVSKKHVDLIAKG